MYSSSLLSALTNRSLLSARRIGLLLAMAAIAALLALPSAPVAQASAGDAVGKPTITGTAEEGVVLTAGTGAIADPDGIDDAVFTYQWQSQDGGAWSNITGATAQHYYPSAADIGKPIRVVVSFDDDHSNAESLTSDATAAVQDSATRTVPWSATVTVGASDDSFGYNSRATPTLGSLSDTAFQLQGQNYTLVTVIDTGGGALVTVDPAVPVDFTFAVGASYTRLSSEAGTRAETYGTIYSWSDGAPGWSPGDKVAVAFMFTKNADATGAPAVSGTAQVGEVLTADTSGIADPNGLPDDAQDFTYQWQRSDDGSTNWTDVTGATAPHYYPTDADVGKYLRVQVSFKDADEFDEDPLTSAASAAVLASPTLSVPWSGTVTLARPNAGSGYGSSRVPNGPYGALSPNTITVGTNTYTVELLIYNTDADVLGLALNPKFPSDFSLLTPELDPSFSGDPTTTTAQGTGILAQALIYQFSADTPSWADADGVGHRIAFAISRVTNADATGKPTITGTTRVGEVLTADTSGIADPNGLPDDAQDFTYQWQRSEIAWTDITGAEAPHYFPTDDDVGKVLRVQVSFEDEDEFDEGPLTSAVSAVVLASETLTVPWSATVTVGSGVSDRGYSALVTPTIGSLSDTTFQLLSENYTVSGLWDDQAGINMSVDKAVPIDFTLAAGLTYTRSSDGATITATTYEWSDGSPGWSADDKVAVALIFPRNLDPGGLAFTGAYQTGQSLTANTSKVTDPNGLTSPTYTYAWERVSCDDSANDGEIMGETSASYTVVAGDLDCNLKVTVTFKDDVGYPETLSQNISPRGGITSIAITSDPGDDDTYADGDVIQVSVTYNEAMTVTGTPQLELDVGGTPRQADYSSSNSSTTVLAFRYTVANTDLDADGVSVDVNKLTLNGGTINTQATPVQAASLLNPALADDSGHKVDGVPPTLSSATVAADGQSVALVFSEDLDGTASGSDVAGRFTLRRSDNSTVSFGSAVFSGDDATLLTLSTPSPRIQRNWVLTLSYDDPTGNNANVVQDLVGNDVADITGSSVTNNSDWVPNVDATGVAAVTGTTRVGEFLTANTSGIADSNGLPENAQGFTYQWQRSGDGSTNWTDVTGAEAPHYFPTDADVGNYFRVEVSFEDGDGYDEGPFTSAATAVVLHTPTLTVPWSATLTVGTIDEEDDVGYYSLVTPPAGSLSDTAFQLEGQDYTVVSIWGDIGGFTLGVDQAIPIDFTFAAGAAYTRLSDNATITADTTGTFHNWADAPDWSVGHKHAVALIFPTNFDATGLSVTGTYETNHSLTADTGNISDPNGLTNPTYSYQWERVSCDDSDDDGEISGATSATYRVVDDDLDCNLQVTVTFRDDDGYTETLSASVVALSSAQWALSLSSTRLIEGDSTGVTATLRITNGVAFTIPVVADLYQRTGKVPNTDIQGAGGVHTITIPAGQSQGSITLVNDDDDFFNFNDRMGEETYPLQARVGDTDLGSRSTLPSWTMRTRRP